MTPQTENGPVPVSRIQRIEGFGSQYVRDFLGGEIVAREEYDEDWYKALKFFFKRSFYRGRRDEISDIFRERAFEILDRDVKSQEPEDFNGGVLEEQLWHNGVNNETDRRMVRQTIEFTQGLPERNIVRYAVGKIKTGQAEQIHSELTKIFGIGDKIASFYLRDVALVFGLEENLSEADLRYFQPVDTWVLRIVKELAIVSDDIDEVKEKIIDACLKANVSPLLFNAGAWYAGAYSLELLIDSI